jgi:hypothetical protein
MSTPIKIPAGQNHFQMDRKQFHKMIFIQNALEQGWSVKKNDTSYVFTKKHENLREIFEEDYLEKFVSTNIKQKTQD